MATITPLVPHATAAVQDGINRHNLRTRSRSSARSGDRGHADCYSDQDDLPALTYQVRRCCELIGDETKALREDEAKAS